MLDRHHACCTTGPGPHACPCHRPPAKLPDGRPTLSNPKRLDLIETQTHTHTHMYSHRWIARQSQTQSQTHAQTHARKRWHAHTHWQPLIWTHTHRLALTDTHRHTQQKCKQLGKRPKLNVHIENHTRLNAYTHTHRHAHTPKDKEHIRIHKSYYA